MQVHNTDVCICFQNIKNIFGTNNALNRWSKIEFRAHKTDFRL